jgi:hypothetical protein
VRPGRHRCRRRPGMISSSWPRRRWRGTRPGASPAMDSRCRAWVSLSTSLWGTDQGEWRTAFRPQDTPTHVHRKTRHRGPGLLQEVDSHGPFGPVLDIAYSRHLAGAHLKASPMGAPPVGGAPEGPDESRPHGSETLASAYRWHSFQRTGLPAHPGAHRLPGRLLHLVGLLEKHSFFSEQRFIESFFWPFLFSLTIFFILSIDQIV